MKLFTQTLSATTVFCLFFLFSFIGAREAQACRCAQPTKETAQQAYNEVEAIILGEIEITTLSLFNRPPMVKLNIQGVIKGEIKDDENFFYNPQTSFCGNALVKGQIVTLGIVNSGEVKRRIANSCYQANIKHYFDLLNGNQTTDNQTKIEN